MKQFILKNEKTIEKVENVDYNYVVKLKVMPYEAKMLLEKGANVYKETIKFDGGCREVFFIYCNINSLASVTQ